MLSKITVRSAKIADAPAIADLIASYSQKGIMLSKPIESIIENIRNFVVADSSGKVVGCCAISFFSADLGEIRSLAVDKDLQGKGIGKMLVIKAENILREEGIKNAFALTYSEQFFTKTGYHKVDKTKFPQKIWRDCLSCPKIMQCDEIAMEKSLRA